MAVYVSSGYTLSATGLINGWKPVIGWNNLTTITTITCSEENTSYPATNLSNPSTASLWKSGALTASQTVRVLFASATDVDYMAIARHNFGTGACAVVIQGLPVGGAFDTPGDWSELISSQVLADDSPAMFRFTNQSLIGLQMVLTPVTTQPQAAVVFAGALLVLPNGLPIGHTPIKYALVTDKFNAISQGGDYLGSVSLTSKLKTKISQTHIDPAWYRTNLEPFRADTDATFFFAWAPEDQFDEVGYCWVTNNPQPSINYDTGEIDISFDIAGVAV